MKLNEALLIGGALLAALVLSKGGAVSSVLQNAAIPLLSNQNENQNENQKEITTVIVSPPQFTRIDITEQLRNISSSELEKNLAPLQNQLDETQKYISDQKKIINKKYIRRGNYYLDYLNRVKEISVATKNVENSEQILIRQQGEIDLLNEEYQTRFGGLSRYG